MDLLDISHSREIYTVSRLTREVRFLLEDHFSYLWLEGEISNLTMHASGHWYFSLKDATAQIRCAMFRPNNRKLMFIPKNGMHVLVKANVSLYESRGDFQLLIDHMENAGEGQLRQAYEALKKRLLEEGLFEDAKKKKLPPFPQVIGIITSPTGAAIADILSVLNRRFCCGRIIIYPTLVQGEQASHSICAAIKKACERNECDVLILARGGGSLEDLWPFNEERVARAIHDCTLPLISGVGHEIDFTIADFVADQRAPTPSAAAELIAPSTEDLLHLLEKKRSLLNRLIQHKLSEETNQLKWLEKSLERQHPKHRLSEQKQKLDETLIYLRTLQEKKYWILQNQFSTLSTKLYALTPHHKIEAYKQQVEHLYKRLTQEWSHTLQNKQHSLRQLASQLDALSPLATLKRGYAIAVREVDQMILRDSNAVKVKDKIRIQLQEGSLQCEVIETL